MKTRYRNVTVSPDRHGKLRARFRRSGYPAVYMKHLPDTPGFDAEYKEITNAVATTAITPGSVSDLCARYYKCADFMAKGGTANKAHRRGLIESFRVEFADDLVNEFSFQHIEGILLKRTKKTVNAKGRTVGGQVAAHNLRKQLRRLFAYAIKLKWITSNPVEESDRVGKTRIKGFHTWSEIEIAQYKLRHPLGTTARLALEIILWTGQRRDDARLFGPRHIQRGKINFQAAKNGADLWLPMVPDLRAAIDAMPSVGLNTYLVTSHGKTFSKDGFGNKFREWCNDAGLPHCSAHGLRKAIGRRMAEARATHASIKAVGGWKGDAEVAIYTAAAEQEGLAEDAIARVIAHFSGGAA